MGSPEVHFKLAILWLAMPWGPGFARMGEDASYGSHQN